MSDEDLDLLKRKVEADTHALSGGKAVKNGRVSMSVDQILFASNVRDIVCSATVFDGLGVPTIRIETVGVLPDFRIVVEMVKSRDDNLSLAHSEASGQDQILLSCATWLVRGIVLALHFLRSSFSDMFHLGGLTDVSP